MSLVATIAQTSAPLFLLIAAGWLAARAGYLGGASLDGLAAFVLRVCLPALIFSAVSEFPLHDLLDARYLGAYALGSLAMFGLALGLARRLRQVERADAAVLGLGVSCSNSAFMGYPILHQLLGPIASLALALTVVVENLLMLPLCLSLAQPRGDAARPPARRWSLLLDTLRALGRNQVLAAIALALLMQGLHLHPPRPVHDAIGLLAHASAPAALFFLGGSLAGTPLRRSLAPAGVLSLAKLFGHPLLVLLAMLLLHPGPPGLAGAGVMMAAMPMLSSYPVIGRLRDMHGLCSATVLLATSAAFLTLIAWVAILQQAGWLRLIH